MEWGGVWMGGLIPCVAQLHSSLMKCGSGSFRATRARSSPWDGMSTKYQRNALTEAVCEFRLRENVPESIFEKVLSQLSRIGWKIEKLIEFEVTIGSSSGPQSRLFGYKLTSSDAGDVVQIRKNALAISRMAPYGGWESFIEKVFLHFDRWEKVVGSRRIERIGARYINRFDIPIVSGEIINIEEYFSFNVSEPKILDTPVKSYSAHISSGIRADDIGVSLNLLVVEPVLIDTVAVVLDIDLFREGDAVPQSRGEIEKFLEMVRSRKGEIFEACITDKIRQLIN